MMIMTIKITNCKGMISLYNSLYLPRCLFLTNSENLVPQTHISDKINEYQYILKHAILLYIPSQQFERNLDRAKLPVSFDQYFLIF